MFEFLDKDSELRCLGVLANDKLPTVLFNYLVQTSKRNIAAVKSVLPT